MSDNIMLEWYGLLTGWSLAPLSPQAGYVVPTEVLLFHDSDFSA